MIPLTILGSVALVCGSSLAAWVLWLRQLPKITREEWLATVAEVKAHKSALETIRNALAVRSAFGEKRAG